MGECNSNYPMGVNGSHDYFNWTEPKCPACGADLDHEEWAYCPWCGVDIMQAIREAAEEDDAHVRR